MKLFKCPKCGKIIEVIHNGSMVTMCCGEPMKEVIPNTVDAAQEKHVPKYEKYEDKLVVQVGEVLHPMEQGHYIEWIMVESGNNVEKISLTPGMEPMATFTLREDMTIYAYCNLHGLWMKKVD